MNLRSVYQPENSLPDSRSRTCLVSDSMGAIPGCPAVRLKVELDLLRFLIDRPMTGVGPPPPAPSSSRVEARLIVELARLRFLTPALLPPSYSLLSFLPGAVG